MTAHAGAHLKPQAIRVFDVLIIAPIMLAGGLALATGPRPRPGLGVALAVLGLCTAAYNAANWARVHSAGPAGPADPAALPP